MKKEYINPNIEVINVKLQQMIAGSTLTLNDTDATVTDGYYNDSRLLDSFTDNDDLFDFEDDNLVDF